MNNLLLKYRFCKSKKQTFVLIIKRNKKLSLISKIKIFIKLSFGILELINFLILILRSFFIITSNPLFLIVCLIITSFTLSLLFFFISLDSWFRYILILIYLGGIIILFAYISNLRPNEIINIYFKPFIILPFCIFVIINNEINFNLIKINILENKIFNTNNLQNFNFKLSLRYNHINTIIIINLIIILLLLLIIIIKLINIQEGPLRCI